MLKVISRSTFDIQAVLNTLVESAASYAKPEMDRFAYAKASVYRLAALRLLT